MDYRKWADADREQGRAPNDADEVGPSLLLPDVRREAEGANGEGEVPEAEDEGCEGVVEREVLQALVARRWAGLGWVGEKLERIVVVGTVAMKRLPGRGPAWRL